MLVTVSYILDGVHLAAHADTIQFHKLSLRDRVK